MLRNLLFAAVTFISTHALSQNLILNPGLEIVDPAYELPEPDTFAHHNIPGGSIPVSLQQITTTPMANIRIAVRAFSAERSKRTAETDTQESTLTRPNGASTLQLY